MLNSKYFQSINDWKKILEEDGDLETYLPMIEDLEERGRELFWCSPDRLIMIPYEDMADMLGGLIEVFDEAMTGESNRVASTPDWWTDEVKTNYSYVYLSNTCDGYTVYVVEPSNFILYMKDIRAHLGDVFSKEEVDALYKELGI